MIVRSELTHNSHRQFPNSEKWKTKKSIVRFHLANEAVEWIVIEHINLMSSEREHTWPAMNNSKRN